MRVLFQSFYSYSVTKTALFCTVREEVIMIGTPFTTLFYGYVRHNTDGTVKRREEAIV